MAVRVVFERVGQATLPFFRPQAPPSGGVRSHMAHEPVAEAGTR
jgi:hypothetical protein